MVTKAYYEEKLQLALTSIQKELEKLNAEEIDAGDEKQLKALKERAALIEEKLEQLSKADDSLWKKLKSEVEDILQRMGAGFENVAAANETEAVIGKKNNKDPGKGA